MTNLLSEPWKTQAAQAIRDQLASALTEILSGIRRELHTVHAFETEKMNAKLIELQEKCQVEADGGLVATPANQDEGDEFMPLGGGGGYSLPGEEFMSHHVFQKRHEEIERNEKWVLHQLMVAARYALGPLLDLHDLTMAGRISACMS